MGLIIVILKNKIMNDIPVVISPELQEFMDIHQIPSVAALLQIEAEQLLKMEGFGWRLMKEVLKLSAV